MSSTPPACTVVVPTRDRRELLHRTLASILAQRGVRLEVVVVDEGSGDGTFGSVAALGDERVRLVRHDVARGLPAARNAGLELARTPWVAFCDDDDLWAPVKLARQFDALARTGASWCCTGAVEVDDRLQVVGWQRVEGQIDPAGLLRGNLVPGGGSSVVARTAVVRHLGGFDTSLRAAEDWELWLRLVRVGPPAVVDEPLVAYRVWEGGMSRDIERMDAAVSRLGLLHGVQPGRGAALYRVKQAIRGGRRATAAAALVRLALDRRDGRIADLAKAPGAALFPARYLRVGLARASRRVPAGWEPAVATWLPDPQREPDPRPAAAAVA